MARTLWLFFITVYSGSCALWVYQPPEIHAQEGTLAVLPCSFNASQGTEAIGSVTWYRDKVAPRMEVSNVTPEFRGRVASFAVAPRFIRDHKAELLIQDTRGHDAGVYVCRVEVLGTGIGTGNGTKLLVEKGPPQQEAGTTQETHTALFLRAGFYAVSFLSVATGSTLYYQGKCESASQGQEWRRQRDRQQEGFRAAALNSPCSSPPGPRLMGTHSHSSDSL
ncbi:natural cytotoxicity triggering receptor 3 [Nannospalax galili]|uniref:natural cytotoxicity triggering receptor 3 n=1 Tax=Nannospalax galili TaxID=1026970 RepID=UPI000819B108|nr:natural cytotoxicity triggering receptor 3 [Nannospalax galili]